MAALPTLSLAQDDAPRKSLNDIRFENWTEDDWQDNDYYREIRKYITSFQQGKVEDEVLEANKEVLSSKFIVLEAQPMIAGGLWTCISFLESADKIFRVWVYSFVNEDKEKVLGYEVRTFRLHEEPSGLTKEDYLEIAAYNPKVKLW